MKLLTLQHQEVLNIAFTSVFVIRAGGMILKVEGPRIPKKCRLPWLDDAENFSILIVSKRSKKPMMYFLSVKWIKIMF